MKKTTFIYLSLLWLLFAIIYLYPFPGTVIFDLQDAPVSNAFKEYIISGVFVGWFQSIIVLLIGALSLVLGIKRQSLGLVVASALIGLIYSVFRTGLEVFFQNSAAASKHGISVAISNIATILRYEPDFVLMEVLVFLFCGGVIFLIAPQIRHITMRFTGHRR